jgi:hypothetical protein
MTEDRKLDSSGTLMTRADKKPRTEKLTAIQEQLSGSSMLCHAIFAL